jgi:hypothetical protein
MEFFVFKDGQQGGPYSLQEIQSSLATGAFSAGDLCWHEGLTDWQPISMFVSMTHPMESNQQKVRPPHFLERKTDALSIWSLVLGILSWLCFSIIAGIPAIICGHISLGRIKRDALLQGKGMAIAGLVLGYVSLIVVPLLVAAVALPAVNGALERGKLTQSLNNARQINLALMTASIDALTNGKKNIGYPVDARLGSVAEVKQMLINESYLTSADAEKIGFEKFLIGNVSVDDPDDTILIKSKPVPGQASIVFRKAGDGEIVQPGRPEFGSPPPREPPFLE